jgi:hypothetical protein
MSKKVFKVGDMVAMPTRKSAGWSDLDGFNKNFKEVNPAIEFQFLFIAKIHDDEYELGTCPSKPFKFQGNGYLFKGEDLDAYEAPTKPVYNYTLI